MHFSTPTLLFSAHSSIQGVPGTEYDALEDLYNSTSGVNWDWRGAEFGARWNFTSRSNDPCLQHWQGINCTFVTQLESSAITSIKLAGYNLVGTLPSSLSDLIYLEALALPRNKISGTLPPILEDLLYLRVLNLQGNALTGPVPVILGSMRGLERLFIGINSFTGTIPPQLGSMHSLTMLIMGNNHLHGTIPHELTQLQALHTLDLYHCHLSGTLPVSLGNLTSLSNFNVYNNSLSGPIPEALGNLTRLVSFTMGLNKLTGTLPVSIGNLVDVVYINLFENSSTGTIPQSFQRLDRLQILYLNSNGLHGGADVLCGMHNISQLYMSNNSLSGTIPSCLGDRRRLTEVYLDINRFTGAIPDTFGSLDKLLYLVLDNNHLASTIPESIGRIPKLSTLQLFNNHLHGSVPTTFSGLKALNLLQLQNNFLSGPIEHMFNASLQRSLQIVLLNSNQFTGPIPSEPFNVPDFSQLSAVDNCLRGSIPDNVCRSASLNILALDGMGTASRCRSSVFPGVSSSYVSRHPALQGSIPSCLFSMPNLTTLHLSGTGAAGTLPYDLQLGPMLIDLALSHNTLAGAIPRAIQERKWYHLDLSYNRFDSTLLSSFSTQPVVIAINTTILKVVDIYLTYITNEADLDLQNNRLSGGIPSTTYNLPDVSMLDGNLFGCKFDESDLPRHDAGRSGYQCGSDSFDPQYYLWLAVAVLSCTVVALCRRYDGVIQARFAALAGVVLLLRAWKDAPHRPEIAQRLTHFHYVDSIARVIFMVATVSTVYIGLLLTPLYAVLSYYFTTITYKYTWTVSCMFLSGVVPFAMSFVALMVLLVVVIKYSVVQVQRLAAIKRSQSAERVRLDSAGAVATKKQIFSSYATFFATSFVTVLGVNVGFVYVVLYGDNRYLFLAQLFLATFKGFWNSTGSVMLMRWAFHSLAPGTATADFQTTLLFASLMNNIAIPCIVVALISPDCFYNLLVSPPAVSYMYAYLECAVFFADRCLVHYPRVAYASFHPPFTYSFECAAQYLMSYAPTFVYLALEVAFVMPALQVARAWLYLRARRGTRWFQLLAYTTPRVLKLVDPQAAGTIKARDKLYPCYDANLYLVQLMTYLSLLLTFGAVFPPLAPCLLFAILSLIAANRLVVGRYMLTAIELGALHLVDNINKDCRSVGHKHTQKLQAGVWLLVFFGCFFYALFLFDILGDRIGLRGAYWVLLLVPLLSVVLYAVEAGVARLLQRGKVVLSQTGEDCVDVEMLELGADEAPSVEQDSQSERVTERTTKSALHEPQSQ
jgi:Leucine-rich repeat (LRR) protein